MTFRVFLGGTCNESTWRDEITPLLNAAGIETFNPVVDDWNEEAQRNELRARLECDICLYVITPKKIGDYSIAEAVDDSNKRPERTMFALMDKDGDKEFSTPQKKSLRAVGDLISRNTGDTCDRDLAGTARAIIIRAANKN